MGNQHERLSRLYKAWLTGRADGQLAGGHLQEDAYSSASSEEPRIEAQSPVDLRQQTVEILSRMRRPRSEEKTALEARGYVFLPIDRKTYAQVVKKDQSHFHDLELYFANDTQALRDYAIPVATDVGLNPAEFVVPDSFDQPMNIQLEMAEVRSQAVQAEFPDARVIMLPIAGYAQADRAYKKRTGEVLFTNFFARGLDMLSEVNAALAGRNSSSGPFYTMAWDANKGYQNVALVPAVVFVNN